MATQLYSLWRNASPVFPKLCQDIRTDSLFSFLSTTSAMRDDDPPPPLWPPAVMELSLNEACRQRQSGHQSGRGGREGMGRLPTLDARRSVIEKSGEWVVVLLLDDDKVSAASGGGGMEKTRITMRESYFP